MLAKQGKSLTNGELIFFYYLERNFIFFNIFIGV